MTGFIACRRMTVHPQRAWGQYPNAKQPDRLTRFTPTGVGTITESRLAEILLAVHPHGRGDNVRMPAVDAVHDGSPPRAWGQCVGYG